jgi:ribosomal RNA-processing protein 8
MDQQPEKRAGKPRDGDVWSKSKKKRIRALKAKQKRTGMADPTAANAAANPTTTKREPAASSQDVSSNDDDGSERGRASSLAKSPPHDVVVGGNNDNSSGSTAAGGPRSKLQQSFRDRLSGSRFRILNEELYTTQSTEALQRFRENPHLFDEYHEGFRQQVSHWPVNPVSVLVDKIRKEHTSFLSSSSTTTTSRKNKKSLVVADFGCGDASLARQLLQLQGQPQKRPQHESKVPIVVHSFDLVARGTNAELITPCDSANTPLQDATVDIGVFCLSLMGTNLADFIREAHRVLKDRGILHIAEVRSRFEESGGGGGGDDADASTTLQHFIKTLDKLGFECSHVDRSNTMFVLMELRKNGKQPDQTLSYTAKPCIYKRR